MTKADLVKHLADNCSVTRHIAELMLNELATAVRDDVKAGNEVTLPNIGKIKVIERAARNGRNPRTGETVEIAAKRVVKFSPSQALKDAAAG